MQYFKHQANMRHDIKIKRLINKYGLEGYGLYNLIVESITESLSTESPLPDLQENCEDIAEFYNGNTAKINEMVNYMINQGLFELNEISGLVMCNKVYKFLDTSQTRSEHLRQMIKSYRSAQKLLSHNVSDSLETVSNKSERREEKEENKKEKELEKDVSKIYPWKRKIEDTENKDHEKEKHKAKMKEVEKELAELAQSKTVNIEPEEF